MEDELLCYQDMSTKRYQIPELKFAPFLTDLEYDAFMLNGKEGDELPIKFSHFKSAYLKNYEILLGSPIFSFKAWVNMENSWLELKLLPNFMYPARTVLFQMDDKRLEFGGIWVDAAYEFGPIDPHKFQERILLHKEDEIGFRRAVIEILRDRLGDERYETWTKWR